MVIMHVPCGRELPNMYMGAFVCCMCGMAVSTVWLHVLAAWHHK